MNDHYRVDGHDPRTVRRTGARFVAAAVAVGSLLLLAACSAGNAQTSTSPARASAGAHTQATIAPTATPSASAAPSSGPLQHIVIIMDENKPSSAVIGNSAAPYLNRLAKTYAQATNYSAITHPSLPNYLALTSGSTNGITTDCNPPVGRCALSVPNIGDEITASGRTWKMYAESMPAPCSSANSGDYAVKHNPFLYYTDVTRDSTFCAAHDVPYSQFAKDLASADTLPSYSYISPNLCHDMHNCSVADGDAWLARNVPRILTSPAFTQQRSLLVITFDEGDSGSNVIPCILAGSAAKLGYKSATPFTHYSLLRTVEAEWGLAPLTAHDTKAKPMTDMLTP